MARKPFLPEELLRGPFTIDEAVNAGLTRHSLEGSTWRRIAPAMYVWSGLAESPMHKIEAARRRLPAGAAFSGRTAAWLHGLEATLPDPIEVTVPLHVRVSGRAGMAVRRSALDVAEVVQIRGAPVTSVVRTLADLCARLSLVEAVVLADAALHQRRVKPAELSSWAALNPRRHGIRRLRRVLDLAEPASESQMESRLRMVLVLAGLPRPTAQVAVHDHSGRFAGRLDLYYERSRLGIEYDGANHRDRLAEDNRRQNKLLAAGVQLLRFTAGDVLGHPDDVVNQVRSFLLRPTPPGRFLPGPPSAAPLRPQPAAAATRK
jgi:very-short-patch-repair endonuclease